MSELQLVGAVPGAAAGFLVFGCLLIRPQVCYGGRCCFSYQHSTGRACERPASFTTQLLINGHNNSERRLRSSTRYSSAPATPLTSLELNAFNNNNHSRHITPLSSNHHGAPYGRGSSQEQAHQQRDQPQLDNNHHVIGCAVNDNFHQQYHYHQQQQLAHGSGHCDSVLQNAHAPSLSESSSTVSTSQLEDQSPTAPDGSSHCPSTPLGPTRPSPPLRQVKFLDDFPPAGEPGVGSSPQSAHQRLRVRMDETVSSSTATATSTSSTHHHQHHVTIVDHRSDSNPQITVDEYAGDYAPHEDNAFRTKIDSSYEGWDNPFRPEGQLSHEAEELLRLWRAGKLKNADGTPMTDEPDAALLESTAQAQKQGRQPNGNSVSGGGGNNDMKNGSGGKPPPSTLVDTVKKENMPQLGAPGKVQHVTLGDDNGPKKKKGCCSIIDSYSASVVPGRKLAESDGDGSRVCGGPLRDNLSRPPQLVQAVKQLCHDDELSKASWKFVKNDTRRTSLPSLPLSSGTPRAHSPFGFEGISFIITFFAELQKISPLWKFWNPRYHHPISTVMELIWFIILVSFGALGGVFLLFLALDGIRDYFKEKALASPDSSTDEPLVPQTENNLVVDPRETDPFESKVQECLVVVMSTETTMSGVCAFLNDKEVEFFVQDFPLCCQRHPNEHQTRSFLGGISAWSEKWVYAEAITFIHNDFNVVKAANTRDTSVSRDVARFAAKYEYKLFPEWTHNYTCDEIEMEDFWEDMVQFASKLLDLKDVKDKKVWRNFPLAHWRIRQIHLRDCDFHQVPHPGKIESIPELSGLDTSSDEPLLVELAGS
eukprot:maker-scaffold348_size200312-snap-gene-0.29 protein:Tk10903 transcript:maker-scaffold348_size200312-snap-gene-0.29-mRNA-1 annotation:"hypothetical protein DAPPUDRAFT_113413"